MAFNVSDKYGNHIGITNKKYPIHRQVRELIALGHDCRNLFGKIKEDKLTKILKEIWQNIYSYLGIYNENQLLRLLLIERKLDFFEYINFHTVHFKGYILYDIDRLKFQNEDTIILEDELDYVNELFEFSNSLPIIFKVTELPRVHISEMGLGEGLLMGDFADLGGSNHTQSTFLSLKSGNANFTMSIPLHIHAQKDKVVQLYLEGEKIKAVLCGGVIYSVS